MNQSAIVSFAIPIAFATGLLAVATRVNAAEQSKTNVLFLICDDLNCDLGCYGHPLVKSPHIDRLAERGVRFERAYCQYPLCGPSRASFMTGLYPDQTLIRRNAIRIREHLPDVVTMSQLFRNNGYTATRIGKIYHYNVPAAIGTDGHDDPASWDQTLNPIGRDKAEEDKIFSLRPGRFGATLSWLAAEGTDKEQTDGIGASMAVDVLKKHAENDTPFFLAVGLFRPHTPFVAPKKYFEMYPRDEIVVPEVPDGYLETLPEPTRRSLTRKKEQVDLSKDMARQAIQAYYASISFADAQLGRILDALEETGLDQNTVVVFTSDHGYHMGEHGHYQKTTLFENAARVPLVITAPGMEQAGATASAPVEMVDFYPTLAELCGLDAPDYLSGVSLVPALEDPSAEPRRVALTQYRNGYSIRVGNYRYTEWGEQGADGSELYDRSTDPEEMVNLASDERYQDTIKRLSRVLHERIAAVGRPPVGVEQVKKP